MIIVQTIYYTGVTYYFLNLDIILFKKGDNW